MIANTNKRIRFLLIFSIATITASLQSTSAEAQTAEETVSWMIQHYSKRRDPERDTYIEFPQDCVLKKTTFLFSGDPMTETINFCQAITEGNFIDDNGDYDAGSHLFLHGLVNRCYTETRDSYGGCDPKDLIILPFLSKNHAGRMYKALKHLRIPNTDQWKNHFKEEIFENHALWKQKS